MDSERIKGRKRKALKRAEFMAKGTGHSCNFSDKANKDFIEMVYNYLFRLSPEIIPAVLYQSMEGHAENGHCKFRKPFGQGGYPNVTQRDIILCMDYDIIKKALGRYFRDEKERDFYAELYTDPDAVADFRQKKIMEVFDFVDRVINGENPGYCRNVEGKPLLGLESLAGIRLDEPAAFLNGVYFGSVMDNYDWRQKVGDKYGIRMGGGECYRVSIDKLVELGLTISELSIVEHTPEMIKGYMNNGLIIDHGQVTDEKALVYFRLEKGRGSIDDLSVIITGLLLGESAAIGDTICDATDTFDKYTTSTIEGGYDEALGKLVRDSVGTIRKHYPDFNLMSEDKVVDAMALIAGENYTGATHCSVRYFNQIDPDSRITAFESHMKYLSGENPFNIPSVYISHPSCEVTNHTMYSQFRNKLNLFFPELVEKLG